jgi:hypothetical protein
MLTLQSLQLPRTDLLIAPGQKLRLFFGILQDLFGFLFTFGQSLLGGFAGTLASWSRDSISRSWAAMPSRRPLKNSRTGSAIR